MAHKNKTYGTNYGRLKQFNLYVKQHFKDCQKIVKTINCLWRTFTQDCKHNKYYVIQYIITETDVNN